MMARWHRPISLMLAAALASTGCLGSSEYDEPRVPPPPEEHVAALPPPADPAPGEADAPLPGPDEFDDTDPSAITDFREPLEPYGAWVEHDTYGTVWVPHASVVGPDFAPYVTAGHWTLTEDEQWLWVSDYDASFGWAVYHYGRWVWASDRGWVWIPGRRWAPAWVVWRVGEPGYAYIGWAPMPPAYYWVGGTVIWLDVYPRTPFVFCHTSYVFHHHVHHHIVPSYQVRDVAGGTRMQHAPPPPSQRTPAQPTRGPSVSTGHVPASVLPPQRFKPEEGHTRYMKPSTMGRTPRPISAPPHTGATQAAPRPTQSRSLGKSFDSGPPPSSASERAPRPSPGPVQTGPSHRPPAPSAPPQTPHTGPSHARPPAPSRPSAPAPSPRPAAPAPRPAPAPAPRPSPAPAPAPRPSPGPSFKPSAPAPAPARPSKPSAPAPAGRGRR